MKQQVLSAQPDPKCVAYVRTGINDDPWDIQQRVEQQVRTCLSRAGARCLTVVRLFKDIGASANNMRRPGLTALSSFLASNPDIRVVVVSDLTRVARTPEGFAAVIADLGSRGVAIVSQDNEEEDNPRNEMVSAVMMAIAQFASDARSRAIKAGIRRANERRRAA
jgi:DNA invertase Pin-like site-specific DNA recombinase